MSKISQYKLLASWFGSGYSPKMPGTIGSLAALPFAFLLYGIGGSTAMLIAAIATTLIGIKICDKIIANDPSIKDPGWIVIDEVAGLLIALMLTPMVLHNWAQWGTGFIIFRLFDIYKPWPVSIPDKKMTGGKGIMLDDVYAGLITAVIMGAVF